MFGNPDKSNAFNTQWHAAVSENVELTKNMVYQHCHCPIESTDVMQKRPHMWNLKPIALVQVLAKGDPPVILPWWKIPDVTWNSWFHVKTRRRMARERRGAGPSLVSM